MNEQHPDSSPTQQLVRIQRMVAILSAAVSGDETALAQVRAGEIQVPSLPPQRPTPHSPASRQSIDALPKSEVTDSDVIEDCAICLDVMGVGAEIKWMPCQHGFHSGCIEAWLVRRDTCPVCRYRMGGVEVEVVVDVEAGREGDDSGDDGGYEYDRVEYFD